MPKRTKKLSKTRPVLKIEALEQRQLLASGFTAAEGQEFSNIVHANGNVYDQVLMKTSAITVMNDPGQITRVSFLDLQGDIVQAEFYGAGSLSISLDDFSGPAEATKYNQPGVKYVSGLASFTIQGSDATTNFTVFSVGTATAHGGAANTIFTGGLTGGDNTAEIQRITIVADPSNPNGSTFGGIRAGNAIFTGDSGVVGIAASNVQVQNVVTIGDIDAEGTAIPVLIFGTNSQFGGITVAGGDLINTSGASINNTGSYAFQVTLGAGTTSGGTTLPALDTGSQVNFTGSNPFAAVNNTFTLTTSVDTIPGMTGTAGTSTNGNDTINATLNDDDPGSGTLTALDSIDAGKGLDTINILDLDSTGGSTIPGGIVVTNVETVNYRGADDVNVNTSAWTGVTAVNVTQAVDAKVTAPTTTAVTVAGATGKIEVDGGSTVGVTVASADTDTVTVGATTQPTGAVTISSSAPAYTAATADNTLGAIAVTGGTTVSVTQSAGASSAAATDTTPATVTQSAVTVTGGDSTTAVVVVQDAAVDPVVAKLATTGTKETTELTFSAVTTGQTIVVNGLTFTASKGLTAAEVAAAFANLSAGATQGSAPAANGIYSGTLLTTFVSGAAASNKVTFTAASVGNPADVAVAGTGTNPTAITVQGTASQSATTGKMGVVGGDVTIADGAAGADKIASVTLAGFGATSTIASDALTTLSLSKSNEDLTITNGVATSLGLTVDAVGTSSNTGVVNLGGTYTTVNLTATGTNSFVDLTGAAVTTLTVNGSKVADLDGSTLAALKTVTVTETAGLVLDGDEADTITSINASGTSGAVTATINPTTSTYAGSSGVDTLTFVTGTNPSKTINLGAGDDVLTLAAGTTTSTSELNGGDGTDTLVMAAADAATASATATFETKITSFEKLSVQMIASGGGAATVNMENMDDINYVITAGSTAGVAAVAEVVTVTFDNTFVPLGDGSETIIFDGVTVTYVDGTPTFADFLAAVAAGAHPNWNGAVAGDTIVFTSDPAEARTDLTAAAFTGTEADEVVTVAVTTQGVTAVTLGGELSITKLANASTVELTGAAVNTTVSLKDATATTDTLNLVTKASGDLNVGTVTAADVETINLTATDTSTSTINTHTINLKANEASSVVITGNANVTLTLDATTDELTSVDGSAMTGKLTTTGNLTVAQTITGGSAADSLTAGFQNSTLNGGGGADTLVVNGKSLVTLTGGAGNDTFNVSGATTNVNSYATITDLTAGDQIKFGAAAADFVAAAITLDPTTAVFQDYANAAIASSDAGDVSWFQYAGNTYVVQNVNDGASFLNGTDVIVKINGLVNLATASFSSSADTLVIV